MGGEEKERKMKSYSFKVGDQHMIPKTEKPKSIKINTWLHGCKY